MTSTPIAYDDRFWQLVDPGAAVERLATGAVWAEGPVQLTDGSVVWSDIPNNRMFRWTPDGGNGVYRSPSNFVNGNTLDAEGRLVSCSHGARGVLRTEHDGSIVTLVDRWEGRRFNSPNDLVVRPDGRIWFTDPPYGIVSNREGYRADSEIGAHHVFRFDPATSELEVIVTDVEDPNGLAFSPDGSRLYVSDTSADRGTNEHAGNHHIRVYDVLEGRRACNGRTFAVIEHGLSDGFRLDVAGNLFTSCALGIQVYAPDGTLLGLIPVPEKTSNCCWGGPDSDRLYITATSSLYTVPTRTTGHGRLA